MTKNTTSAENVIQLKGQATPEQIDAWKKSHINGVEFIKRDGRIGYFKRPSFKELDAFYESKTNSASEEWKTLAGLLFIGGDRELIESPRYLPGINRKLLEMIKGEEAEMGEL